MDLENIITLVFVGLSLILHLANTPLTEPHYQFDKTRADQNTGGALLEFPMKTAMHGKSRVSSAISVCDN